MYSRSRSGPTNPGIIPMGAGGVVDDAEYGGISSGSDYHHAYQTSMMARFAPDMLAKSVRGTFDEPWQQEITPQKPLNASMVGSDVFGPPSFQGTVRNSLLDLRGEAAYSVDNSIDPPLGASDVGWRNYALANGPASVANACGTCSSTFARGEQRYSGGLACTTCASEYSRPSSAQLLPSGVNMPRSSVMSRVRSAFLV